jgi:endonuclease/exonuclease/phosphatase family metal-dependent hydrolase
LGITPGQGVLSKEPKDKLFKKVSHAFQKQVEQAKVVDTHLASSPYKTILCGDFNNGQYSNVYRIIKGNLQDTFLEAGNGYGHTYIFHGLPFRIDFIFASDSLAVKSHVNYDVEYSDHFPVMASFDLGID